MKVKIFIALLIFGSSYSPAQLKITRIEKLPLDSTRAWGNPKFSPDGQSVYYTTENYDGIWVYSLQDKSSRQLTIDRGAGFGFAIAPDGNHLTYRKITVNPSTHERSEAIILLDQSNTSSSMLGAGRGLSTAGFAETDVIFSSAGQMAHYPSGAHGRSAVVLGIEQTKISLYRNGEHVLLDPLDGGSYCWPSLSPDGHWIVAYDMERGTFICDLNGSNHVMLGRKDAPAWTRDSRWIVYSQEKNDGYRVLASSIGWISSDGLRTGRPSESLGFSAVNPHCSPVENRIVCGTLEGQIYLIDYSEEGK